MLARFSRCCWFGFDLKVILQCQNLIPKQRRNGIRWRPGQESSLAPPCSNLRSFGSKCTVLKKVANLWHFWDFPAPPTVIRIPENCFPLALPLYAPVPRAEFSKSRSDLTFVAMSLTSIGERQFCLFNKAHKNIKNILFSSMSWQRRE